MAFQPVQDGPKKKKEKVILGHIKKAKSFEGFYLKIPQDCELVLFEKESGGYYQINKTLVKVVEENPDDILFELAVNLDSPNQVKFLGK